MGKRKGQSTTNKETLTIKQEEVEDKEIENEIDGDQTQRFFGCYLLTSLSPRHKGHTYIGFTVNPRRRIRQHNGELRCGAWRTKHKRPWEMVLCIHGFPTNVSALQFEWAWQHPRESLAVRKVAASFKSFSGVANKIKLAYTMLTLPNWQNLDITVNYFSTKYMKNCAGCPSLPVQMKVRVCPMDELPCYVDSSESLTENGDDYEGDDEVHQVGNAYGMSGESLVDGSVNCMESSEGSRTDTAGEQFGMSGGDDEVHQVGNAYGMSGESLVDGSVNCMESSESSSTGTAGEQFGIADQYMDPQPMPAFGLRPDMQFCLDERSPVRVPSPVITEENPFFFVEDGIETINHPKEYNLAATTEDNPQPCSRANSDPQIEVIDVFTPSPNYRSNKWKKRRRAPIAGAEIIDLTESPIVV